MKKTLLFLVSLSLFFAAVSHPAWAANALTLTLSASQTVVSPGDTVTVTVAASSNPGFLIFGASPAFDINAMEQQGGVTYGSVGSGTNGKNALIDAGSADTAATGVLFSYTVKIKDGAPSGDYALSVTVGSGMVVNSAEEDVPVSVVPVTVTVGESGDPQVPAPAASEGEAGAPAPGEKADPAGEEEPGTSAPAVGAEEPKAPSPEEQTENGSVLPVVLWSGGGVLAAAILLAVVWIKRKKRS